NEAATEVCPHAIKGSSVEDISWKFSGTMEQQASLYKNTYQVYTLDPIEVVATPEDTASEVQTLKHQSQEAKVATKNYKIFSDEMDLFENILSTNSFLLMAAGIT